MAAPLRKNPILGGTPHIFFWRKLREVSGFSLSNALVATNRDRKVIVAISVSLIRILLAGYHTVSSHTIWLSSGTSVYCALELLENALVLSLLLCFSRAEKNRKSELEAFGFTRNCCSRDGYQDKEQQWGKQARETQNQTQVTCQSRAHPHYNRSQSCFTHSGSPGLRSLTVVTHEHGTMSQTHNSNKRQVASMQSGESPGTHSCHAKVGSAGSEDKEMGNTQRICQQADQPPLILQSPRKEPRLHDMPCGNSSSIETNTEPGSHGAKQLENSCPGHQNVKTNDSKQRTKVSSLPNSDERSRNLGANFSASLLATLQELKKTTQTTVREQISCSYSGLGKTKSACDTTVLAKFQNATPSLQNKLKQSNVETESEKATSCALTDKYGIMKELTESFSSFTFVRDGQLYMCNGQLGRGGESSKEEDFVSQRGLWVETSRLASFALHKAEPPAGVWFIRLSEAGFYYPGGDSVVARCVSCGISVEISEFAGKNAMQLHKEKSPACSFVNRTTNNNRSAEQLRQEMGTQYTLALFGGAATDPASVCASLQSAKELARPQTQDTRGSGSTSQDLEPSAQDTAPSEKESVPASQGTATSGHESVSSQQDSAPSGQESGSSQHDSVPLGLGSGPSEQGSALSEHLQPIASQLTESSAEPRHDGSPVTTTQSGLASALPQSAQFISSTQQQELSATGGSASAFERDTAGQATDSQQSQAGSESSSVAGQSEVASEGASSKRVTYRELGIYTEEPKRRDFAIAASRLSTFNSDWPHSSTHAPADMAEAGFYYVGQGDLVRCFYCRGGLKSWSQTLRPWVEHARFFPQCPFVGQVKGQEFINVVQDLHSKQTTVSERDVEEELERSLSTRARDGQAESDLETDEPGINECDGHQLSNRAQELEDENETIRNQRLCKICQSNDVNILFLPCGHLVSCSQCAPALRSCAICRQSIKGRVRVLDNDPSDSGNLHGM